MSLNAHRFQKHQSHQCQCGRPALFFSLARGRFRFRPDHPLCLRCYRSLRDHAYARRFAA